MTIDITHKTLTDFVYAEARMLDEQRFDDWLNLFAEDGYYWMPLAHGQIDPRRAIEHVAHGDGRRRQRRRRVGRLHRRPDPDPEESPQQPAHEPNLASPPYDVSDAV